MSLTDPQTFQTLAIAAVLTAFALAEMLQGRFFARTQAAARRIRLTV